MQGGACLRSWSKSKPAPGPFNGPLLDAAGGVSAGLDSWLTHFHDSFQSVIAPLQDSGKADHVYLKDLFRGTKPLPPYCEAALSAWSALALILGQPATRASVYKMLAGGPFYLNDLGSIDDFQEQLGRMEAARSLFDELLEASGQPEEMANGGSPCAPVSAVIIDWLLFIRDNGPLYMQTTRDVKSALAGETPG